MSFLDTIGRAKTYLEKHSRVSLRVLKLEFGLDDARLEALVEELVNVQRVAVREDELLVRVGPAVANSTGAEMPGEQRAPRDYTPKHLADKILRSKSAVEGERKQVTVLFADVKSSMELAEQLDPEEWHCILDRFFSILTDGVHRFEGTVNQYTGDGIMALFGAPIAHEDHAKRACHAALGLCDQLGDYAAMLRRDHGIAFATRIGMNSGEVVVGKIGDDLRMDYTAQGHTVGLAQRMEALAEDRRPRLTEATARLVEGFFELEELGRFPIKGASTPVRVFALLRAGTVRSRIAHRARAGLSRLVGRDEELDALMAAFREADAGRGQVVGLVAGPGLGKSRLAREFMDRVRAAGARVMESQFVSHGRNVPLLAYLDSYRDLFGLADRDDPVTVRRKITAHFDRAFPTLRGEYRAFWCDLLGAPDPDDPVPAMSPEERQRRLLEWEKRAHGESRGDCVVGLMEDLHWIDPASEAVLDAVVGITPGHRQMIVCTYRPEYSPPWRSKSFYRQSLLPALSESATGALIGSLLGPELADSELARLLQDRCGGTPFFVEEMIQSLAESGCLEGERGAYRLARPVAEIPLPSTIQSVLAARIDRLGEREKQVLQTASVIGRVFPRDVLESVAKDAGIDPVLRALMDAELVYEESVYPEPEYSFKHALVQDVAYASQLKGRREELHRRTADALERYFAHQLDAKAALVAQHWDKAGEGLEAARWYRLAAEWTSARDVHEAASLWRRLCGVLEGVSESQEWSELRLAGLLQILNLALRVGVSLDEAALAFTEARELATRLGDPRSLGLAFNTYSVVLTFNGRLTESLELCEEATRAADRTDDGGLRLHARMDEAFVLFQLGHLQRALEVCESALTETPEDLTVGRAMRGFSPYIHLVCFRGEFGAVLGQLPEARRDLERSLELALEHGDVELPGWIYFKLADWSCYAGDSEAGLRHARSTLENAEQTGSRIAAAEGYRCLGNAYITGCAWSDAVGALQESLRITREEGVTRVYQPLILAWLADGYLGTGLVERALATAAEAIETSRRMGTRWKEIAGHLASARALRVRGADDAAEAVTTALTAAEDLVKETGARVYLPFICEERAALAALRGDGADHSHHLREAHRLFTEVGAKGHAERLAKELGL